MTRESKRLFQLSPAIAGLFAVSLAWAEVPVVESTPMSGSAPVPQMQGNNPQTYNQPQTSAENSLYYQLELLQQEVQTLRGMLEEQSHAMRLMKQEQRDRYIDLDRRIGQLSNPGLSTAQQPAVVGNAKPGIDTAPTPSTTSGGQGGNPEVEKAAYSEAFALIKERKFDDAVVALKAFLEQYPSGAYSANARYWLGEVYLATEQSDLAQTAFERVLSDFPKHRKAPDASYKLGRAYYNQGDLEKARSYFQATIDSYPGSTSAKLSQEFLKKL
ncbi:tol-pal system protein YbgF [Aestuariirhabdus sp. Z084]|uniref:tol-pal system protein YbgF n=1 Tax=Aestuariirhabdus haliotis TaxID=2918751 RepID=UPI00201B3645|nr:tol-pal system protein YbgF [Aestuariirhabdus haliotis]MCL6416328.1 tol-pal system protein YbgF [Aestuariirhabdus haliotis]MCL6420201.1 tol-pal system protein YbgF [Aestuariirhabdus haliotis]